MEENNKWKVNFFIDAVSKIELKMHQLVEKIIEMLISAETVELKDIITALKSVKYSGQAYMESLEDMDEKYRRVFDIGYLQAVFDLTDLYERRINVKREIDKIRTGYRDRIFFYLCSHTTLLHKELASLLQISPSGLNAVIKMMNAEGVKTINAEKVSKYTVYSLTPIAYQYAVQHGIYDFHRAKGFSGTMIDLLFKGNEEYLGTEKVAFVNLERYQKAVNRKQKDLFFDFAKNYDSYKNKVNSSAIMTDTGMARKMAIG